MSMNATPDRDWFEFLSDCWPFSSLPALIVELVAAHMKSLRCSAGEWLMRAEEKGNSLMVLVDGLVDLTRIQPLARLGYMEYTAVEDLFAMPRPAD